MSKIQETPAAKGSLLQEMLNPTTADVDAPPQNVDLVTCVSIL